MSRPRMRKLCSEFYNSTEPSFSPCADLDSPLPARWSWRIQAAKQSITIHQSYYPIFGDAANDEYHDLSGAKQAPSSTLPAGLAYKSSGQSDQQGDGSLSNSYSIVKEDTSASLLRFRVKKVAVVTQRRSMISSVWSGPAHMRWKCGPSKRASRTKSNLSNHMDADALTICPAQRKPAPCWL